MNRVQWSSRPNRESLAKRLGKKARQIHARDGHRWPSQISSLRAAMSPTKLDDERRAERIAQWIKKLQAAGFELVRTNRLPMTEHDYIRAYGVTVAHVMENE